MPIKNKKNFIKQAAERVQQYQEQKLKGVRIATLAAYSEILEGSPVDTGRFRSNWMISAGTRSTETIDGTAKTFGASPDQDELKKGQDSVSALGNENMIYISNSLPYAKRLEEGHSAKNQGFVARAERNLRKRLKAIDSMVVEN